MCWECCCKIKKETWKSNLYEWAHGPTHLLSSWNHRICTAIMGFFLLPVCWKRKGLKFITVTLHLLIPEEYLSSIISPGVMCCSFMFNEALWLCMTMLQTSIAGWSDEEMNWVPGAWICLNYDLLPVDVQWIFSLHLEWTDTSFMLVLLYTFKEDRSSSSSQL